MTVAIDPVHFSHLKDFGDCPKAYRWFLDHPRPETAAMRLGSYVDKLVLGTKREFQVFPGKRKQGKKWDAFQEAYGGVSTVLSTEEAARGQAIAEAVLGDPIASEAIAAGAHQVPLSWVQAGRECAGTADVLSETILADLKVSASADPRKLKWHVLKMGWDCQLAWYMNGAVRMGLPMPRHVQIVVVASKPPYACTVLDLQESALLFAEKRWFGWFEQLRQCEESDTWPAYSLTPVPYFAPDDIGDLVIGEEEEES